MDGRNSRGRLRRESVPNGKKLPRGGESVAESEKGIEESAREQRALLNGFPAVNHGVSGCKIVAESVNVPIQARHGTPDSRLLAEIIHAAGWTSNEGGAI